MIFKDMTSDQTIAKRSRYPEFILVGAPKSGTTFLLRELRKNPRIFIPDTNEIYFHSHLKNFQGPNDKLKSQMVTHGLDHYLSQFSEAQPHQLVGEFATDYLFSYHESIPSILSTSGPDTKIIIILRNPIDRATSHYKHLLSKGDESLPFWEAIEKESDRERNGWRWSYRYIKISLYFSQVKAFMNSFANVKVLIYEEMQSDKKRAIAQISEFLGVESAYKGDLDLRLNLKNIYSNRWLRYGEVVVRKLDRVLPSRRLLNAYVNAFAIDFELSSDERRRLREYFTDDVRNLETLLCRKIRKWDF